MNSLTGSRPWSLWGDDGLRRSSCSRLGARPIRLISRNLLFVWRRGRDSNPRKAFAFAGFQVSDLAHAQKQAPGIKEVKEKVTGKKKHEKEARNNLAPFLPSSREQHPRKLNP